MARFLNRLRVILDRGVTAASLVDLACEAHPDRPLFHADRELPYDLLAAPGITPRQLKRFVNRLGNVLLQQGMRPRDRVAIYKTNGPDYVFLALAVIRAGGIAVPVNPGMELPVLRGYLESVGATLLITDADVFRTRIGDIGALPSVRTWIFPTLPGGLGPGHVDLRSELEHASEALRAAALDAGSPVLIVHTSGTTGRPKAVISTSGSLVRGIKGHFRGEPVSTRERIGVAGHFNHLVYFVGFGSSLVGNLPLYAISTLEPDHVAARIAADRISLFFAFPDVYLRMYERGLERYDLSGVKIWISTADACHEPHMRAFCRRGAFLRVFGRAVMGSIFVEALGSTEVGFAALQRIRFSFSPLRLRRCVGRPTLAGPRVRVADENGRPVPRGRVGRLMVKGPTLFAGYWTPPENADGLAPDGWWWTGDLVRRGALGRFYHLDRAADVVCTPHGPVYTLPVEEVLLSHPAVAEAAVFGAPDGRGGEEPVAAVYPREGCTLDAEELRAWAAARLPVPPSRVQVVGPCDLPRGLTGKVLKRRLRDRYADAGAAPPEREPALARA